LSMKGHPVKIHSSNIPLGPEDHRSYLVDDDLGVLFFGDRYIVHDTAVDTI
jgi:hypothetical protein